MSKGAEDAQQWLDGRHYDMAGYTFFKHAKMMEMIKSTGMKEHKDKNLMFLPDDQRLSGSDGSQIA